MPRTRSTRGMRRLGRRRITPRWGDSLAPLLDVIFLLVIFLLVSARFDHQAVIDVELPTASSTTSSSGASTPRIITLHADGSFELDGQMMTSHQLSLALSLLPPEERLLPVMIRGDRKAQLGDGVELLDLLRVQGFHDAVFEVKRPQGER